MKAKCVRRSETSVDVTEGKIYDVVKHDIDDKVCSYKIKDDNGTSMWINNAAIELIPDEPAPKSEWMRCDCDVFINMTTGLQVRFVIAGERRVVYVFSIHNPNFDKFQDASGKFADSFAALVGYDWPSAGEEM